MRYYLFIVITLLLIVFGCKKEKAVIPLSECEDRLPLINAHEINDERLYYTPVYNPNDPGEIALKIQHNDEPDNVVRSYLYIYDIGTEELRKISSLNPTVTLQWTSTNKLVFSNLYDRQIYMVNPDDGAVKKVTRDQDNFLYPHYNTRLKKYFSVAYGTSTSFILDSTGTIIDSIPELWCCHGARWSPDGRYLMGSTKIIYDYQAKKFIETKGDYAEVETDNYFTQWYKDTTKIIWYSGSGFEIYIRDMLTGKDELIYDGCSNNLVRFTDVHPTENKILGIQLKSAFDKNNTLRKDHLLIEYNLDTQEINVILE